VAAFVAGWLARALIAWRERRGRAGVESPAVVSREHLEEAVEATRKELDRAIRSHVAAVALSEQARGGGRSTTPEAARPEAASPDLGAPEPARPEAPEPETAGPREAQRDLLADQVSAALQDDAANEYMLSAMNAGRVADLSERELDLTDWGFAYGVAWARAQERGSSLGSDALARRALRAAEDVFRAYTAEADWREQAHADGNGRTGGHPEG
jgi:hypothetical protein